MRQENGSEWAESRFPLYGADRIESLYVAAEGPVLAVQEPHAALIAVAGGSGTLEADGRSFALGEGSVYLLPPNVRAVFAPEKGRPIHAYKAAIVSLARERTSGGDANALRRSEVASPSAVRCFAAESPIAADLAELYVHRLPDGEARHIRNQLVFQRILLRLLELSEGEAAAGEASMERSVAYMEARLEESITTERLADIAGVSRSHYPVRFRQLTGFSPNEYLSRLRLNRTKELLLGGARTLRDIAAQVGYKDEFYLSRRFKQQTGETPSAYARRAVGRVAVLRIPYACHLLLLGLEPAITLSESGEYVNAKELPAPKAPAFVSPNGPVEPIKAALIEGDVELIIAAREHMAEYGLSAEQLRAAAPVAEIPWMELGWKEQLRLIARAVRRSERAERWLAEFEQAEQAARESARRSIEARETVTIFVVKPDRLFAYGARNVGYAIYRSLGLTPPAPIADRIERLGDRFHSVPVALDELPAYAGDRLLLIAYPDEKGSVAHAERMSASPEWRALPAVQAGNVHRLDVDEWVPYNPVSIRLQLDRAAALFAGNR